MSRKPRQTGCHDRSPLPVPMPMGTSQQRYLTFLLATSALTSLSLRPVYAQNAAEPADEDVPNAPVLAQSVGAQTPQTPAGGVLEEVIVRGVARRYLPDEQTSATGLQMRLIDTPQSISVITPEMLDIANARSAYDAADMIPGVEKSGQSASREVMLLRGQPLVSPRINGIGRGLLSYPDSFALERLEFVRGPATVLYGLTGAFGGEVNSILKKPQPEWRTEASFQAGDFDRKRYELDVTGAVPGTAGRLSARAVGAYTEYGFPVETPDVKNIDRMVLASVGYELTPDWHASLFYYRDSRDMDPMDGCALLLRPDGTLALPEQIEPEHFYCGNPGSRQEVIQQFYMAALEHRLANDWRFKAQAAYSKIDENLSYMFPFGPAGAYGLNDNEVYLYTYDISRDNGELTFNTSLGGEIELFSRRHKFHAALEYQDNPTDNRRFFLESRGVGTLNIFQGGLGILADGSPIPFIDRSTLDIRSDIRNSEKAYRGSLQALLNPHDRLEVLAGLLWQRSDIFQQRVVPVNPAIELSLTELVTRFGVTFDLTEGWGRMDDARVYASYAEGFVPNVGVFGENGQALTDPQRMDAYEVGLKAEFFEGFVTASIAAYDQKVTNLPATAHGLGGIGLGFQTLKGAQKFRGIEAEVLGEILPGWNVALSYGYTETEIEHEAFPDADLVVRSVPKNRASLFTSYEFLGGPVRGLRLGTAVIYKDDYPFVDSSPQLVNRYGQLVDSGYTRLDFDVSYRGFTGSLAGLEIFAHLENATDVDYFWARNGHPGFSVIHAPPRTVSFGIRYTFDRKN